MATKSDKIATFTPALADRIISATKQVERSVLSQYDNRPTNIRPITDRLMFINRSGETIPAYGLFRVPDVEQSGDDIVLNAYKPSTSTADERIQRIFINDGVPILAGKSGFVQQPENGMYLLDCQSDRNEVEAGDIIGVIDAEWHPYLEELTGACKDIVAGYQVVGFPFKEDNLVTALRSLVYVMPRPFPPIKYGKATIAYGAGETNGTFDVYMPPPSSTTSSVGEMSEVYCPVDIDPSQYNRIEWDAGYWIAYPMTCAEGA
jgi:hypothetical protein